MKLENLQNVLTHCTNQKLVDEIILSFKNEQFDYSTFQTAPSLKVIKEKIKSLKTNDIVSLNEVATEGETLKFLLSKSDTKKALQVLSSNDNFPDEFLNELILKAFKKKTSNVFPILVEKHGGVKIFDLLLEHATEYNGTSRVNEEIFEKAISFVSIDFNESILDYIIENKYFCGTLVKNPEDFNEKVITLLENSNDVHESLRKLVKVNMHSSAVNVFRTIISLITEKRINLTYEDVLQIGCKSSLQNALRELLKLKNFQIDLKTVKSLLTPSSSDLYSVPVKLDYLFTARRPWGLQNEKISIFTEEASTFIENLLISQSTLHEIYLSKDDLLTRFNEYPHYDFLAKALNVSKTRYSFLPVSEEFVTNLINAGLDFSKFHHFKSAFDNKNNFKIKDSKDEVIENELISKLYIKIKKNTDLLFDCPIGLIKKMPEDVISDYLKKMRESKASINDAYMINALRNSVTGSEVLGFETKTNLLYEIFTLIPNGKDSRDIFINRFFSWHLEPDLSSELITSVFNKQKDKKEYFAKIKTYLERQAEWKRSSFSDYSNYDGFFAFVFENVPGLTWGFLQDKVNQEMAKVVDNEFNDEASIETYLTLLKDWAGTFNSLIETVKSI